MHPTPSIFDSTPTPTPTVLSEPLPPMPTVTYHLPKSITIDGGEYSVELYLDGELVTLTTLKDDPDYAYDAQFTTDEARALAYWLLIYANQSESMSAAA